MRERLPFLTKFFYGFGSMAYGIKDNAFAYFLLFVYVQVFGLSPQLAGLAIFIMLIVDAISDPIIGYMSDRTRSSLGRRHPYIYLSALPVSLSFFFLWDPPSDMTQYQLFLYLLGMGVVIRTAITFYEIPSTALGPELSKDYVERSSLMSYRYWFGWWGGLAVWNSLWIFVVYSSLNQTTDARYLPSTWSTYGLVCSIVMFVAIFVTAAGTHRHIKDLHIPKSESKTIKVVFSELYETMTVSKDYLVLFLAMVIMGIAAGITTNLTLYFYSYFWEFSPINILTIGLTLFLAPLAGLKLSPFLTERMGKRNSVVLLFAVALIVENVVIAARLFCTLPENGADAILFSITLPFEALPILNVNLILFLVLFCHWIAICCQIISYTILAAMVFDTVEEVEQKTGRRMEGTLLAARSFAAKCMSGAGAFLAGIILTYSMWPEKAKAGEIPDETLFTMGATTITISLCLWALALVVISRVKMTQEIHDKNLTELEY